MPNLPWSRAKTLDELSAENERLEVEYSVEQKRDLIRRLKAHGVKPSAFSSIHAAIEWLKSH